MRHSWEQEKGNTKQTLKQTQTTQNTQTAPTPNNNKHLHLKKNMFCVLLCLLCSLLTFKGTRGIVGNKKTQPNKHRTLNTQHKTQTAQTTTNNGKHIHVCRFVFCDVCYARY